MEKISGDVGYSCGFGSHTVTVVPHFLLRLSDGIQLSLKIWFPRDCLIGTSFEGTKSFQQFVPLESVPSSKFPVILEHLPYRKSDYTLQRDFRRHTWMCSHGYAVIRSDTRGNGDSEGLYFDEYESQESDDACEIIQWAASQSWCNGRVGMYGKSWGGFNGLQVAYKKPNALKTVISLYSTDDRYATDIHYMGGCVLAVEMIGWSSIMFGFNGRPPNPTNVADWKHRWIHRLENQEGPFMNIWLPHQARDDYWKQGSICEDPTRIEIPILAIGGFADCYPDAVFRMAKSLPVVRGIVGPWPHDWPDCNAPGPHIEFMTLCKEWWDLHLNQVENQAMDSPLLQVFVQDSVPPSTAPLEIRKGKWVAMNQPQSGQRKMFFPSGNGKLLDDLEKVEENEEVFFSAYPTEICGLVMPEFLAYGGLNDGAGDQKVADAHSLCWTSEELQNDVTILGNPEFECLVSADKDQGNIAVRLVDVFPDGKATLITFGVLNLTHREGHSDEDVKNLVPGEKYKVKVELRAISYAVPRGHRIRVAVSPNYFPMIWPSRENVTLQIFPDANHTRLVFPVCPDEILSTTSKNLIDVTDSPKLGPPLPKKVLREPSYKRYSVFGRAEPTYKHVVEADSGRQLLSQVNTIMDGYASFTYSIEERKPLSAEAVVEGYVKIEYPDVEGGIATCVDYTSKMWSDYQNFFTDSTITVSLNDEVVHKKTWKKTIPRYFV